MRYLVARASKNVKVGGIYEQINRMQKRANLWAKVRWILMALMLLVIAGSWLFIGAASYRSNADSMTFQLTVKARLNASLTRDELLRLG